MTCLQRPGERLGKGEMRYKCWDKADDAPWTGIHCSVGAASIAADTILADTRLLTCQKIKTPPYLPPVQTVNSLLKTAALLIWRELLILEFWTKPQNCCSAPQCKPGLVPTDKHHPKSSVFSTSSSPLSTSTPALAFQHHPQRRACTKLVFSLSLCLFPRCCRRVGTGLIHQPWVVLWKGWHWNCWQLWSDSIYLT